MDDANPPERLSSDAGSAAGGGEVERPHWGVWVSVLSGMGLLGLLALSPGAHAWWSRSVTTATPRWLLQGVFVWALLLHVYKGMKAVRMAERAGLHETSMSWGWQTFALGFPSLWKLEECIERGRAEASGEPASQGTRRFGWLPPFPNVRWLLAAVTLCHRWVYLSTGGRVGHLMAAKRFLLLTHTGRRSGRRYVVPLLYVEDGDRLIVAASNAGDERDPQWLLNLQSRPEVEIQVGLERFCAKARRANPEESQRLWPQLIRSYRWFARYRSRTRREIPLVIFERTG